MWHKRNSIEKFTTLAAFLRPSLCLTCCFPVLGSIVETLVENTLWRPTVGVVSGLEVSSALVDESADSMAFASSPFSESSPSLPFRDMERSFWNNSIASEGRIFSPESESTRERGQGRQRAKRGVRKDTQIEGLRMIFPEARRFPPH